MTTAPNGDMKKYTVLLNYNDAKGRLQIRTIKVWAVNRDHLYQQLEPKYGKGSIKKYLEADVSEIGQFFLRLKSGMSFVGLLLLVLVVKTVFFDEKTPASNAAIAPPAQPAAQIIEPVISAPIDDYDAKESVEIVADMPMATISEPAPAPESVPTLRTYFAEVRQPDGVITTIELSASDADRAIEIIRDFRGNPEILQGPTTERTW